jgi:hypothetical protein
LNIHSRVLDAATRGWHVNSVYIYRIGAPLNWDNGGAPTPGDYVFLRRPRSFAASVNNAEDNTTAAGVALPAFNTALFATSSTHAFAYHIRTFSTTCSFVLSSSTC